MRREPRFLGIDLAWQPRNPSGLAALDRAGRLIALETRLRGDAEILAWMRRWLGDGGVIGIDMPTIVRNPTGSRACERALGARFRARHAGPYPANLGLAPFANGGRAAKLIAALRADGVTENPPDYRPGDPRTIALEVFPHAAHVELFSLDRIFKYKRKAGRSGVLSEWKRYRAALGTLCDADPPLVLGDGVPVDLADTRGYKAWDDALDAITCAYVAAFVYRWGLGPPHTEVVGDRENGYIVVPMRSVWATGPPGTTAPWTVRTSPS